MVSSYHDDPNHVAATTFPTVTHFANDETTTTPNRREMKYGTLPQLMTIFGIVLLVVVLVTGTSSSDKSTWTETNVDGVITQNVQWTDRFGIVHTKTWPVSAKDTMTASITGHGQWWETTNKDGVTTGNVEWTDRFGKKHTKEWSWSSASMSQGLTAAMASNEWWNGWTSKDYADYWAHHDDSVIDANADSSTSSEFWEEVDDAGAATYHIEFTDRFGNIHQKNWTIPAPSATTKVAAAAP